MESIVVLFVHILALALVFSIVVWMVNAITSLPIFVEPVKSTVRVLLLCLMGLIAIAFLLGDLGAWGTWGWGYHRRW